MNEIELERRLCVVEDRSKSNSHRLGLVEKRQEDMTQLVTSVAAIAQKQQDMDGDVQEIKAEVKAINQKPAKRWESIVEKTILAAVGVLVAYVAVKLGLM
jgi:peptidoglycan hydrolase CwlO-like protein